MSSRRTLKHPDVMLAFARYADEANITLTLKTIASVTGIAMSTASVKYNEAKAQVQAEKGTSNGADQAGAINNVTKKGGAGKRKRTEEETSSKRAKSGKPTKSPKPSSLLSPTTEEVESEMEIKDEDFV